ncbi:hypothetical protein [Klebsiella michiganensis]
MKQLCLDIEFRYQVKFLEIGMDEEHFYLLVQ